MGLKRYIFKIAASVLFVAASLGYILMPEKDRNIRVFSVTGDERSAEGQKGITEDDPENDPPDNGGLTETDRNDNRQADPDNKTDRDRERADSAESVSGTADDSGTTGGSGTTEYSGTADGTGALININTADALELTMLPGIGPAKADAIVAYRNEHGRFAVKEDIMNVPGIKSGTFGKIEGYICCE